MKPSKTPIVINAITALLFASAAIAYFASGKPVLGAVFCGCVVLWISATALTVRTYRIQMETYELTERFRRSPS